MLWFGNGGAELEAQGILFKNILCYGSAQGDRSR